MKKKDKLEEELNSLREKQRQSEELTIHLRSQLLATHAQRIKMEGYLYKYRPYPNGFFTRLWEDRYFCLVDSCLKCFLSESTMALIPEIELYVNGCRVQWDGLKREKYWTFSLHDAAGCLVIQLSSTSKPTAERWVSFLNSASTPPALRRLKSLPTASTLSSTPADGRWEVLDSPKAGRKKKSRPVMVGSTPVHQQRKMSVLTSERLFEHPHPGLLNLGAVVLIATNFRLVLENLFKYGIRVNPLLWLQQFLWGSSQPLMFCWPVLGVCCGITFLLEKLMANQLLFNQGLRKKDQEMSRTLPGSSFVVCTHVVNSMVCFLVALWLVYISEEAILPSFVLTLVTVIVCMKMISFAHCNSDLRLARLQDEVRPGERDSVQPVEDSVHQLRYPENITLRNFFYFLLAPTLTYQPTYPRSETIRRRWLARRCGELAVAVALLVGIIDQYIIPAVDNSMLPMEERNFIALIERVLKLSIPVLYAWLIMFYILFHLWLNILAEWLRFGDREFYTDWWNALNLGDYWKKWNTPVHRWMLRTLYYPVIHLGFSRSTAMLLVFFVSALVHEILVIIPLKFTSTFPWSFVGMILQVPLIFLSQFLQKKFGDRWGNIIFWVSFCVVGQPICLLYYYYDWIHANATLQA